METACRALPVGAAQAGVQPAAEPAGLGGSGAEPTDWTDALPAVAAEAVLPCLVCPLRRNGAVGVAVADAPEPVGADPVGVAVSLASWCSPARSRWLTQSRRVTSSGSLATWRSRGGGGSGA